MGEGSERIEGSFSRNISEISMEISLTEASSTFPGFRFSPTDEELIEYYLKKKIIGSDNCVDDVIPEVDICRHEPWDLPAQSVIQSDNEWFFFTPRGRKYPKGSQSKRATEFGYWKATGKERTVKSGSNLIGTKRTLVFHIGRAPKGQRTEWIMHEYCTSEKSQDTMVVCRLRKNNEFHINDNQGISSLVQSDMSVVNDGTTALYGVEKSGMVEGTKVGSSCSKEYNSSYDSQYVEQVDSGSESDDKVMEFNQHNSSSNEKVPGDCVDEEDFYADIMKDDIITLDDSSLNETAGIFSSVSVEPKLDTKSEHLTQATVTTALPLQYTANRRLRLRWPKLERRRLNLSEASKGEKEYTGESVACSSTRQTLLSHFPMARVRCTLFLVLLVFSGATSVLYWKLLASQEG